MDPFRFLCDQSIGSGPRFVQLSDLASLHVWIISFKSCTVDHFSLSSKLFFSLCSEFIFPVCTELRLWWCFLFALSVSILIFDQYFLFHPSISVCLDLFNLGLSVLLESTVVLLIWIDDCCIPPSLLWLWFVIEFVLLLQHIESLRGDLYRNAFHSILYLLWKSVFNFREDNFFVRTNFSFILRTFRWISALTARWIVAATSHF